MYRSKVFIFKTSNHNFEISLVDIWPYDVKYVRSNSLLEMILWYMLCSHDVININLKGSNVHACAIIYGSNKHHLHDSTDTIQREKKNIMQ